MTPLSDAARRALRTGLQTLVGLCVLLPPVLGSADLTGTLPWAAGAVAVAGGLSRLMALPAVQVLLPSWLRTEVPVNSDQALRRPAEPEPAGADTGADTDAAPPSPTGFGFTAAAPAAAPGSGPDEGSGA